MKVSNIDGWPCYYISKSGRLYSNKRGRWIRIRGELCNNRLQYRLYKRINTDLLGNKRFTQFAKRGKENHMYGKSGKLSPFYGIPRSSETKKLISIANKGRKVKEDTKLKISNTLKSLKRGKTVPLRDDIIKLRYEDKLSLSAIAWILWLHQTAISKFLRNYEHSKE